MSLFLSNKKAFLRLHFYLVESMGLEPMTPCM